MSNASRSAWRGDDLRMAAPYRPPRKDLDLVAQLRDAGLPLKDIQAKFEIDRKTLYRWLNRYAEKKTPGC